MRETFSGGEKQQLCHRRRDRGKDIINKFSLKLYKISTGFFSKQKKSGG
jgi:hypothetical protein